MTEKVKLEIEIPKGHYEALAFLCNNDPNETLENYLARTVTHDIESLIECNDAVGDFVIPRLKAMIKGSNQ